MVYCMFELWYVIENKIEKIKSYSVATLVEVRLQIAELE